MYNYSDGDIFAELSFPSGFSQDDFINTVLLEYGECETLYASPGMMKIAISSWGSRHTWGITRALAAINEEYDPLHNYNRTETRSRTESGTNTGTVTDAGSTSSQVSSTAQSETNKSGTNENEHKVSAYDASTYSPSNTDDGSTTENETGTGSGSSNATGTSGNTRTNDLQHNIASEETMHAYGNIGVTTSQSMLTSELQISLYNIYETFAAVFAEELLILVY